jgi:OPA family glycerol-3-phosphate transporter-like MFS transporter
MNRYVQSAGWVALVKTASRWFPYHRHASIMAILSLSFLIGDVFARNYLGALIHFGVGWRGVFFAAAAALGLIALVSTFTLKSTPEELGLPEPEVNPANVFGQAGESATPGTLWDLLGPMFVSPAFWFICGINFGLTLIREAFNLWTPTMLTGLFRRTPGANHGSFAILACDHSVAVQHDPDFRPRNGSTNIGGPGRVVLDWAVYIAVRRLGNRYRRQEGELHRHGTD